MAWTSAHHPPPTLCPTTSMLQDSPYHVGDPGRGGIKTGNPAFSLDEMCLAFARFFGGKLSPAPLDQVRPARILDLGCGTGAWAIQAATQFPEAQVLAVDLVPLPDRHLPPNINFLQADLEAGLGGLPVGAFDIVYSRQVLVHLANASTLTPVIASLVAPGGTLILGDIDFSSMAATGGPATRRFVGHFTKVWAERGADLSFGRNVEGCVRGTRRFKEDEVFVRKVQLPLSGRGGVDEATNELGVALRRGWLKGADSLSKSLQERGFTENMARAQEEELNDENCQTVWDMYFVWATLPL
ncbi:S-adenosyl-L-methionine-dependent methyltransferase [Roridomyces roridus]|uniref:S-adenosyl-L-methionine-dependent methyltransferase n=1 Tax=Roridomyces roridus TaxID=1738132 RepID=A0AAD7B6I2_9AGAR|nr:S-adenosyl-L-methionine-dependent methyltransferase [Roridomyces roridus]